jgi:hypothetical protein
MIKKLILLSVLCFSLNLFSQKTYTFDRFKIAFETTQELETIFNSRGTSAVYENDNVVVDIEAVPFSEESPEFLKNVKYGATEITRDYELGDITDGGSLQKVENGYYVIAYDLEGGMNSERKKYPVYVLVILDKNKQMAFEISIDCYNLSKADSLKIVQSFRITQ